MRIGALGEHDEARHEVRDDFLQTETQPHAEGRDQPLHVVPFDAEEAGREQDAAAGDRVARHDLDRIGRVGLHLESLQQRDVEQRAHPAHGNDGDHDDHDGKDQVIDGQRARDLFALDGLRVAPQRVVADCVSTGNASRHNDQRPPSSSNVTRRFSSDPVCSPIAPMSRRVDGSSVTALPACPWSSTCFGRPASSSRVRASCQRRTLYPQRRHPVEHHGAQDEEDGGDDSHPEIAGGDEVARRRQRGDREGGRDQRREPDRVQSRRPAARRAGEKPLHQRVPAPQQAHEEHGEGDHGKAECQAAQALAVGERRVVQSVQRRDEDQRHQECQQPAQSVRGRGERRLVPAEVADRQAPPVEQPRERGK